METKKSKIGCLLKGLVFFIIIIGILFLSAFIFYRITREDVKKYIPDDYFGYVKIDSITSAYNNLIDLRAADIILSQEKLRQVYKTLLEFRNSKLSNNKFLTSLLNMNVNIVLKKDYSPVFLVDLGFKSIILRSSRFITKFVERRENFSLDEFKNKDKKYTIYRLYIYSNQQEFYFSIHKNLLFFALQKEDIDNLYDVKMNGNNIYNDDNYYFIKKQIKKGGIAEIYYNTDEVIKPLLKKMAGVNNIIKKLKLDTNSAISFNISNDDLFFSSFTKSSTQDEKLQNFLENNAGKLDIIQYLPDDTNLYTAINIQSFEEFYKLFLYLQEGGYEKTIEKIDNACQVFFKMSIDEIIFSWIGSEIGAFTSTISSSPVIFLKIKDKKQNKMVFDKLVSSILLEDSNLNFDGVNLNKISFPDFLQSIIRNFAASFDTPYYTIIEDFIFFSMDPASLVNMVKKYDEELTLNYDNVYRDITSKVEKKATLFLYFNLGTTSHKLLQGKTFIPKLLKLYEKGVLTINLDNSSIRLDLAAAGINIKKTHLFPGYPKKIESVISSPVICRNITGSGLDELIYTTQNKKLMVADINNNSIGDFPVRIDGINKIAPIINDLDNNGELEIYVFTEKGTLHKYDTKGYKEAPYPISTEFKGSPAPVLYNGKLIFYSKNDKKIYFLKSNKKEEFNFEFKTPLLSPITISKNIFAFYPKSFNGTIFLTNDAGKTLNGWPNDAGGIGYGSPIIEAIGKSGAKKVIFITQSGNLNIWNYNGNIEKGFPLKMDGIYYTQPIVGDVGMNNGREIITLNKDGLVSIISDKGNILIQKKIKDAASKDRKMLLFDADKNGKQEIFIYGGTNNIIALNSELDILSGFPVKGNTKPDFTDFNSDGQYEMVVGSVDSYIYAYTIPE